MNKNNNTEEIKGNEVVKAAAELLRASGLNFVGNVEGDGIYKGDADVVVCDGFVGNVALKTSEGLAQMLASSLREEFKRNWLTKLAALIAISVLNNFKRRFDHRRYNGAILLGLKGISVKSHGSADILAFGNAISRACEVLVNNVLTLLRVRLNDECLHLLYCEIQRNNLCDAEECRLEDGVGTVAETNLLSNLCCVDIVNSDVVLSEDALHLVRDEVNEFLTVEDSVQQEVTVLAQTACNIVHIQVSLYVASHEVRSIYLVCAVDWAVAETEV
jgi:hypothetical protein